MARRKSKVLTEVELEFMRILWSKGEVTVEEVMEALRSECRPLSDGSVRKILAILGRKGYVDRRKLVGLHRGHLYSAKVGRGEATRNKIGRAHV